MHASSPLRHSGMARPTRAMQRSMLFLVTAAMAAGAPGAIRPAAAADASSAYPSRPVRLVSPFAPGGNTDMVGRTIAPAWPNASGRTCWSTTGPVQAA